MAKFNSKVRTFSALEVAKLCGVVNQTSINWIRNEQLKAFTTPGGQYRIYAQDLVIFLKSHNMRVPDELRQELTTPIDTGLALIVDDDKDLNTILKRFIEQGRLGEKCGRGFYDYPSPAYRKPDFTAGRK